MASVGRENRLTRRDHSFLVLLGWFFSDFSGICPEWGIF